MKIVKRLDNIDYDKTGDILIDSNNEISKLRLPALSWQKQIVVPTQIDYICNSHKERNKLRLDRIVLVNDYEEYVAYCAVGITKKNFEEVVIKIDDICRKESINDLGRTIDYKNIAPDVYFDRNFERIADDFVDSLEKLLPRL